MYRLLLVSLFLFVSAQTASAAMSASDFAHHYINDGLGKNGYGGKVLGNFDSDAELEFIAGGMDNAMYYFDLRADKSWDTTQFSSQNNWELAGAAGDINGDGLLDAVIGTNWYRNNGANAAPENKFSIYRFDNRFSAAHDAMVGDIDNDGKLEVVIISDAGSGSHWYDVPDNPEQNTNWPRHDFGIDTTNGGEDIHGAVEPNGMADLDQDGDLDLVFPMYWLENQNNAASWSKNDYGVQAGRRGHYGQSARAYVVDFDQDGDPDIVMSDSDDARSEAFILFNQGGAENWERVEMPIDFSQRGSFHSVGAADFDGDGDYDVFTAGQEDFWQIGPPDNEPKSYLFENQGDNRSFTSHVITRNLGFSEAKLGDIDADGDIDIASAPFAVWDGNANGGRDHIDWIENLTNRAPAVGGSTGGTTGGSTGGTSGGTSGSGTRSLDSWQYKAIDTSRSDWHGGKTIGLGVGDVNGDGELDVTSGKYLYLNSGSLSGSWQRVSLPDMDASMIVNVDNDQFGDIIAQDWSPGSIEPTWLEATNAQATQWTVRRAFGSVPGHQAHQHPSSQGYGAVQLERGGKPEIVINANGPGIYYFRIPANPQSSTWPRVQVHTNAADTQPLGFGDIDGDGRIDIVAREHWTTTMYWYKNPGTGAGSWQRFAFGEAGSGAEDHNGDVIAVADFTGDGKTDIAVGEERWGTNAPTARVFLYTQGSGSPQARSTWQRREIFSAYSINNMGAADMDSDGDVDLVVWEHAQGPRNAYVLENRNNGASWQEHKMGDGRDSHLGARPADLDQDGDFDVLGIGFSGSSALHLYINTSQASGGSSGGATGATAGGSASTGSGSGSCSLFTNQDAPPQGFGAAHNVLSAAHEMLVRATCSGTTVTIDVGVGSNLQYVYHQGFEWNGTAWQVMQFSGAQKVADAWFVGSARATRSKTASQMRENNFFVAYVCTWTGAEWKCGCRDAACAQNYWQLQAYRNDGAVAGNGASSGGSGGSQISNGVVVLDETITHDEAHWVRDMPESLETTFAGKLDGVLHVRADVEETVNMTPFKYHICLENGQWGSGAWGEGCSWKEDHPAIIGPGVYTWKTRPLNEWWQNSGSPVVLDGTRDISWKIVMWDTGGSILESGIYPFTVHTSVVFTEDTDTVAF